MDNIRTFNYYGAGTARALPTFAEAINWHGMMKQPCTDFVTAREPHLRRFVDSDTLRELWGGLMGTIDPEDETTCMATAADLTLPTEYAVVVRRSGGVAAAFAFCELLKAITTVRDLTDDYEVRQAMEQGWRNFTKRVRDANNVAEGFGCDDSQSWLTLRDIANMPDSEKLNAKMQAIAKLAGRMHRMFGVQHREQPNKDPEEVIGATQGNDLNRVLDSELALLADEDTEDMQAMKLLGGQAPMTDMAGLEARTRGPLVLAIDESGSMHDGDLGGSWGGHKWAGRNTWAKACAVALTRIAWGENRPVRCVHFGNGTEVQEIPRDDTRALFEMARSFLSGGTSFGEALKRSRVVVGDLKADGFDGADILLITDGEDPNYKAHEREIRHMQKAGIKLWTVAIGLDIKERAPVRAHAERYTYAADRDLGKQGAAEKLADGLQAAALANPAGGMVN